MFRFAFLSFFFLNLCAGFAPSHKIHSPRQGTRVASSLADYMEDDDLRFRQMISKARECAYSDSGSAIDARMFLREILHLESGCVSGNLSGEICDNIDEIADIVAHLRVKAEDTTSVVVPGATLALMSTTVLVMLAAVLMTTIDTGSGSTPYTLQEWMWAAQGGYMGNMVEHFIRNGGL